MALLALDFGMGRIQLMLAVRLQEFLQRYGVYKIKHV
jgi:hypothetical protein